MAVVFVPVRANPQTRQSRLIRNIPSFLSISAVTIIRFYTTYRPLRVFMTMGGIMIAGSAALGLRFLVYFLQGQGTGKVQSLILAAILAIVGFQICLVGLLADAASLNRMMLEESLYRLRRIETEAKVEDSTNPGDSAA